MINMESLLNLQGKFFLLIMVGFWFRKHVVGEVFQKGLTDLVFDVILPCNIIMSFQTELDTGLLQVSARVLLISLVNQLLCWVLACVLFRRCAAERQASLKYGTICLNSGSLGTAVADGIWGDEGILLTSIFVIPQRIFMWTVGLTFFTDTKQKNSWKSLMMNPCIIAVIVGIFLMVTQVKLPVVINSAIESFAKCNTGMAMFLIGMITAQIKWKDFFEKEVLYIAFVRLVLVPAIVFMGCSIFNIDKVSRNVSVILVAMPVAGTTAVLASKYGKDAEFAASMVAVSTALSLIAIPLWGLLL